jgi:DNA-binding Xre family transcriptional regulator
MKKLIEIPEEIRWQLQEMAVKKKKNLKKFIQDILISVANNGNYDNNNGQKTE